MFAIHFRRAGISALAVSAALALAPVSSADLAAFSEDFEGLVQSNPTALGDAGWPGFGNVFSPDGSTFLYNYGAPFPHRTAARRSPASTMAGVDRRKAISSSSFRWPTSSRSTRRTCRPAGIRSRCRCSSTAA